MAKKTEIDKLPWIVQVILTIIPIGIIVQGINRMLKGRIIIGILWIITFGLFIIGWIIDIFSVIFKKKITILT